MKSSKLKCNSGASVQTGRGCRNAHKLLLLTSRGLIKGDTRRVCRRAVRASFNLAQIENNGSTMPV